MTNWIFEYKAILTPYTSSIKSGVVTASSLEEAKELIQNEGWTPITVYALKPVTEVSKVELL